MKNNSQKKRLHHKFTLLVIIVLMCFVFGYVYRIITWEPKPDPESEGRIYCSNGMSVMCSEKANFVTCALENT